MTYTIFEHGYLKMVDSMGSDQSVIEAARMSTDKGFLGWEFDDGTERDMKLLRYLYEHKHHTPFEMAQLVIEVQAPIFVFREWHRHRTQSYNELSARYTVLPDLYYVPSISRLMEAKQSSVNKQGSEAGMTKKFATEAQLAISTAHKNNRILYETMINAGVAREIARVVLPVAQYSRMRASANLRNWLAFLTLRMDPAAQWEIRQYANAVGMVIEARFPRTWQLFLAARPNVSV